jgi:hypothetical protein
MPKSKKTPWFDGSVKPVRLGVYQRRYVGGARYARWTGRYWCLPWRRVATAAQDTAASFFERLPWRGLAEEPK